MSAILDLPELFAALEPAARERAEALLDVTVAEGRTDPPPELTEWLQRHFGSVDAVRTQRIVRVTDRWRHEGTLFSPLRSGRPMGGGTHEAFAALVERTRDDEFCHPQTGTPADTWGRVRGRHSITAANAAKYDGQHGVVIFNEHDPLAFDHDSVRDMLEVGREWAQRAGEVEPGAANYLLIWNCGPRAGGSIVHGHAQVLLGRDPHYGGVDRLRMAALAYRAATGKLLLDDIAATHRDLGLAIIEEGGVTAFASLTPAKERELWVVGQVGMDEREPAFADAVAGTVVAYRDQLGVRAFNLVLQRPPIDADRAARDGWELLPPLVRLVDRGDPDSRSSDIGAMELYAAAVVGSDPFALAEEMRAARSTGAIG